MQFCAQHLRQRARRQGRPNDGEDPDQRFRQGRAQSKAARPRTDQRDGYREVGEGQLEASLLRHRPLLSVNGTGNGHGARDEHWAERARNTRGGEDSTTELARTGTGRHRLPGSHAEGFEARRGRIKARPVKATEQFLGSVDGQIPAKHDASCE